MSNIFFLKDGKRANGDRVTHRVNISMEVFVKEFGRHRTRYSASPPTLNPAIMASDYLPYKYVVLEVSEGETIAEFPQIGYYLIEELEPSKCQFVLGLTGPTI